MKKILILVTVLALTIGATAQEKPFTYGVKAGLSLSQLSSGSAEYTWGSFDNDATDMLAGFFVSAHFNYSFGQFFGIQPELSFSMQGGKESWESLIWEEEYGGGKTTQTSRYNYINIPVLFEVKPITNLSIFVGPQIGFNIYKSTTWKSEGWNETISGSDFDDYLGQIDRKFNSVDFAAVVGLQYAILGKYLISARYNIGFSTVIGSDIDNVSISGGDNRVLQFGIGYQF
jgi:hypothetical protein